ncbi:MAG: ribosome-associated translation inhibitor RaiA [Gemmatimonadota bacterium]
MLMTVTARHCEIAEDLRARAEQILDRLAHHASRAVDGTVVFDMAAHKNHTSSFQAELRLHLTPGEILVAHGEAEDHRTALDRAEDKLRHQLERQLSRTRERHKDPSTLA